MRQAHVHIVLSPFQNAFFHELGEAMAGALRHGGVGASVDDADRLIVTDDSVFVLLPAHEYVVLEGEAWLHDEAVMGRTIVVSAEQPHQSFFAGNVRAGHRAGAVFDFSPRAVAAYAAEGVTAHQLRLGYVPAWDRFTDPAPTTFGPGAGPEVLYMGNASARRRRVLAGAADTLARHHSRLVVSDNRSPNRSSGPTFLAGDDKRRLLASTRLMVNVHQSDVAYFEWLRLIEAFHCGTAVLSEPSTDAQPFVAGRDFLQADANHMGEAIDAALADPARLDEVRQAAYATLRAEPLARGLDELVHAATGLLTRPAPHSVPARTRVEPYAHPAAGGIMRAPRTSGPPALPHAGGGHVVFATADTRFATNGWERLGTALDQDPAAGLAWGVVAIRGPSGEPTLENVWPWEQWRVLGEAYIEAPVVVRAATAQAAAAAGAVGLDALLVWMAGTGRYGAHVPNIVASRTAVEGKQGRSPCG